MSNNIEDQKEDLPIKPKNYSDESYFFEFQKIPYNDYSLDSIE